MSSTPRTTTSSANLGRIEITAIRPRPRWLAITGIAALAVTSAIGELASDGIPRLLHAYLLSFCFFLSISLGATFFVILHHLTGARWSVVTRRIAEALTTAIPILALMCLPIVVPMLFGSGQLFEWNDAGLRVSDELIRAKAAYLNAPFFAFRCALYFGVWALLSRFYLKNSLLQDSTADVALSQKMRRRSGPAMIALGLTINFAAFDLLMSLDPHCFSTIFGVYFFASCAVAFFAALPIACLLLQRCGYIQREVTAEHYHDMAKLLFGFNMFWAYIAFSQYLLIWYANIPEETVWFLARQQGGWQFVGLSLIVGHFVLPFFGLMSRRARRDRRTLLFWSIVLLAMHWVDLYWLIMPNVSSDVLMIGVIELLCLGGMGAIWLAFTLRNLARVRLIPTGDPHLRESLAFHNV